MKDLITGQRVRPRKKPSLLAKALVHRDRVPGSAGNAVKQLKQKPARIRRAAKIYKKPRSPFRIRWPNFTFTGQGKSSAANSAGTARTAAAHRPESTRPSAKPGVTDKKKRFSPSFPIPNFLPFVFIAAVSVFSILAIRYDTSFLFNKNIPEPAEDGEFRRNLASYAGIIPPAPVSEDPIPLDLMETFSWSSYQVKRGDSVSKIAAAHGISMDAVIASNGITNARRLREGENLKIPNMNGIPYTVKNGDSLSKISKDLGVPLEAILDANDIQTDAIAAGTVLFIPGARMRSEDLRLALGEFFIYPIRGRLSSPFGWRNDPISGVRRYHAALDMASPTGTPVKAAMDGQVATLGYNSTYGNYIILSHAGGFQTMYAHLNAFSVKKNAWVNQGVKIGEVGNTGYSTGPHLHFAVFKNGKAVNPLDYLHR